MRVPMLLLLLLLMTCTEAPTVPVEAIVLGPVTPLPAKAVEAPRVGPRAAQDVPVAVPTKASVLHDFEVADQLTLAYIAQPLATLEGIERARVLHAAATRAVFLMKRRGTPADIANAAAAVAELLHLVR